MCKYTETVEQHKYHEAGHALAAIHAGEKIEKIVFDYKNCNAYVKTPGPEYNEIHYNLYRENKNIEKITNNQFMEIYAGLYSEYTYLKLNKKYDKAFNDFMFLKYSLQQKNKTSDFSNMEIIKTGLRKIIPEFEVKNLIITNKEKAIEIIDKNWKCIIEIVNVFNNKKYPDVKAVTELVLKYIKN